VHILPVDKVSFAIYTYRYNRGFADSPVPSNKYKRGGHRKVFGIDGSPRLHRNHSFVDVPQVTSDVIVRGYLLVRSLVWSIEYDVAHRML
jgi:hypothetical protein